VASSRRRRPPAATGAAAVSSTVSPRVPTIRQTEASSESSPTNAATVVAVPSSSW
jgi:hypothetical protein